MKKILCKKVLFLVLPLFIGQLVQGMDLDPNQPKEPFNFYEKIAHKAVEVPKEVQAVIGMSMIAPVIADIERSSKQFILLENNINTYQISLNKKGSKLNVFDYGQRLYSVDLVTNQTQKLRLDFHGMLEYEDEEVENVVLAFSKDGSKMAFGIEAGFVTGVAGYPVIIYDLSSFTHKIIKCDSVVSSLSMNGDGSKIGIGHMNHCASIHDSIHDKNLFNSYTSEEAQERGLSEWHSKKAVLSPDNSKCAIYEQCEVSHIKIYSASKNGFDFLHAINENIKNFAFSYNGSLLALQKNLLIKIYNADAGKLVWQAPLAYALFSWIPHNRIAVLTRSSDRKYAIHILDGNTGKLLQTISTNITINERIRHMVFSYDGTTCALGARNKVYVLKLVPTNQTKKLLAWLQYNLRIKQAVAIHDIYKAKQADNYEVMLSRESLRDLMEDIPVEIAQILLKSLGVILKRSQDVQDMITKQKNNMQKIASIRLLTSEEKVFFSNTLDMPYKFMQQRERSVKRKRESNTGESPVKRQKK